ncbi:MAG: PHP domain-containing protein [Dermatophilaceae bacterium]
MKALPVDNHSHSQWSWDATDGDMAGSCEAAIRAGLPAIAFTDHADFTPWSYPSTGARDTPTLRVIGPHSAGGVLNVDGYMKCLDQCREQFPELRIIAGIEAGEPHLFEKEITTVLDAGSFERVLGSVHSIEMGEGLVYAPTLFRSYPPHDVMRMYLAEVLRMVEQSTVFQVLAHIDYPMRAWPRSAPPFDPTSFEDDYRAVLRELARSERALEINTAGPWPAQHVLSWWHEEGGAALSFGADAHEPSDVGKDFDRATALARTAGFGPGLDQLDFWRRA